MAVALFIKEFAGHYYKNWNCSNGTILLMNLSLFSRIFSLYTLLSAVALFAPAGAMARVSGEFAVGYEDFTSTGDDHKTTKSSFHQNYSLMYDKRGNLGRLGSYSFGIGYEWASINLSGTEYGRDIGTDVTASHIPILLDYKYNSRTIPLNISLYTRDTNRITPSVSDSRIENLGDNIVPSGVAEELNGTGSRIVSGATLSFGEIKSDPFASKFPRLVELPKIYLDYSEERLTDLHSPNPQHSYTRWFNSGIGKDSLWLSYKSVNYKDYLAKSQNFGSLYSGNTDYDEQTFSLGTVSVFQERLWVDLTNWIKISVDGSMTKRNESGNLTNSYTEYDLNFFATANRKNWQARTFNTFSRSLDGNMLLDEDLIIPVYISGSYGPDSTWGVRFEQRDERQTSKDYSYKNVSTFASVRVETLKRSPFTLTPQASIEIADFTKSRKMTMNGKVETLSTRRFSDRIDISAAYEITAATEQLTETNTDTNNDTLNQTVYGSFNYRLGREITLSADQRFTVSSGKTVSTTGNIQTGENFTISSSSGFNRTSSTNEYNRSITTGKIAWVPNARLRMNASTSADLYDVKGSDLDTILSLSGGIDYSMPQYSIGVNSIYSKRTVGSLNSDQVVISGYGKYSPAQNVSSTLRGSYSRSDDFGEIKNFTELYQQVSYIVPGRLLRGRLLEFTQQSTLLKSSESAVYGTSYKGLKQLSLQGKYFMTNNLYASAITRYSLLDPGNVGEWMAGGQVGVNYRLLQGNVEYYQGRRSGGDDNRKEKRFSANLKKQF